MEDDVDFLKLIENYDDGRLRQHLDEQLSQLVDGAHTHGTDGHLTLKIKLRKDSDRAVVTPIVDSKIPQAAPASCLFFFDRSGTAITRDNPRQLNLRDLEPQRVREETVADDE